MESSEDDPDIRNDIVQPPSYAEAVRTTVPLPLPPYRRVELRSRSPPPPYSEVIGQSQDNQPLTITAQQGRRAYQALTRQQNNENSHAGRSRGRRHSPSWRTTELQIPRGHNEAIENLLQVRRPPGSLPNLRLLRPPLADPRPLRNGFPTVNNKKIIHVLAGGLGLLIPLGIIIAMATRENPPEVETSTQFTTPSIYYKGNNPGAVAVGIDVIARDDVGDGVKDVHTQSLRRKRRP